MALILPEATPFPIKYCKTLLDTSDIRLIQSDIWNKTNNGKTHMDSNSDQRIHMDYPNNYLTHPNNWRNPDSIAIIIYFSLKPVAYYGLD